jgi:hypothetical protein
MKKGIHPDYHMIDVKMTDGTTSRPARPGARKATRWRWTSTRWRTRPGPAVGQADGHRRPRVEVQEQVRRPGLLIRRTACRSAALAPGGVFALRFWERLADFPNWALSPCAPYLRAPAGRERGTKGHGAYHRRRERKGRVGQVDHLHACGTALARLGFRWRRWTWTCGSAVAGRYVENRRAYMARAGLTCPRPITGPARDRGGRPCPGRERERPPAVAMRWRRWSRCRISS